MAIDESYLTRAEIWVFTTTLVYFLMNGAQIFETAVIVPKWSASPPESLLMFRGKYALDFKWFWIVFHSIHEITFILAIIFCWKLVEIRTWLLILFAVHFGVRAWTLAYFAPNIIRFQRLANKSGELANLISRTKMWRLWNYVRVGVFIAVSLGLIPICIKLLRINPDRI